MVNANELRIGNKLNYSDSFTPTEYDVIAVASINDIDKIVRDVDDNLYTYDTLYPITLTPEILEKLEFKRTQTDFGIYWDRNDISIREENGGYELYASEWTIGKTFYFVHQLQNICLDLFDGELEIKLENKTVSS